MATGGKYALLRDWLMARPGDVRELTLSFSEIERIIGASLPKSASTHREWWSNQRDTSNRPQAAAWMDTGFRVDSVQLSRDHGWVRFRRG